MSARRVVFTVKRNDVRPDGFKRWTVYAGNVACFDIEADSYNYTGGTVRVVNARGRVVAYKRIGKWRQ